MPMKKSPLTPENRQRLMSWLSQHATRPASWLASLHRATSGRHTTLIAVTGSFGKTTTTRAIAAMLGQQGDLEAVPNCFGRLYLQVVRQTRSSRFGVVEIGIGRPNQMRGYAASIRPNVAVVTTIGWEHEVYFPDGLAGIRNEKAELVRALPADGIAVLNRDDERVMWMAQQTRARIVTFGRHEDSTVRLLGVEPAADETRFRFDVAGKTYTLASPLLGNVAAVPVSAAVATAHAIGLEMEKAAAAIAGMRPTLRRLEPVRLPSGAHVVLDDYKGTPPTAHAAFDTVAAMPCARRIAVLGNIPKTTPQPTAPIYRQLGEHAGRVFDRVFLLHLADQPYSLYREALIAGGLDAARIARMHDVHETAAALRNEIRQGDILLLKGHFIDQMSRIALLLQDVPVECRLTECLVRGSRWCDSCPMVFKRSA